MTGGKCLRHRVEAGVERAGETVFADGEGGGERHGAIIEGITDALADAGYDFAQLVHATAKVTLDALMTGGKCA